MRQYTLPRPLGGNHPAMRNDARMLSCFSGRKALEWKINIKLMEPPKAALACDEIAQSDFQTRPRCCLEIEIPAVARDTHVSFCSRDRRNCCQVRIGCRGSSATDPISRTQPKDAALIWCVRCRKDFWVQVGYIPFSRYDSSVSSLHIHQHTSVRYVVQCRPYLKIERLGIRC